MAKYSRMKKYENYRNQIQMGNEDSLASNDLKDFSERLSRIDATIAKDVNGSMMNHTAKPTRVRHYEQPSQEYATPVVNTPIASNVVEQPLPQNQDAKNTEFKNEYLDEFLDEVKKYNVDNGYANTEDTQLNIFSQLKGEQPKKTNVIESYQNGNELYEQTNKVKASEVANNNDLMDSSQLSSVQESVLDKRNSITQELQTLLNADPDIATELTSASVKDEVKPLEVNQSMASKVNEPAPLRNESVDDLLTKTAKQTVSLAQAYDEMDEDLDELEDKMGKNTRIVNFVLALIVLALIVVLIVIVYAILLMRGII